MEDGFVFAGGQSTRMGVAKHLLTLDRQTFLKRSVQIMADAGLRVRIVAGAEFKSEDNDLEVIEDLVPALGPLGALHTALASARSERVYVLACDVPLVQPAYYELLQGFPGRYDVIVPAEEDGGIHPLCAAYSRRCRPVVESLIGSGRRQVRVLLDDPQLKVLRIRREIWGPTGSCFMNINTEDDYRRLLQD